MPRPRHVVMVGTALGTRGGISSVVATYRAAGLFQRWPVSYLETHREGTTAAKAVSALRAFGQFLLAIVRGPKGVLHVHGASRWSFWRKSVFMAAALVAGWPIVFHLHGGGFARFHRGCGRLTRRIVGFFLDRAAVIVVVSERWAAWMRQASSNPRVVCIPNPVALPPVANAARDPALVVFTGRCEEAKGVYDLLDAVSALRPCCPRLRVECAGDGDLARLARHATMLGIRRQVAMRGWIGARDRDRLLARASVFVLPSHAEGLPMSLLEAMAAGCPVIASAVGGIPDLVVHGVNGLLVPPRDRFALAEALRTLLHDPALAARLGREARATVAARYSPERALERLEQVYAGLGVRRESPPVAVPVRRLQEIS